MFDDPGKELNRLQQQLLEEDDGWLDDALADAHRLLGDDGDEEDIAPAPGRPAAARTRNTDRSDPDLEAYSRAVHDEPKKKGVAGLVFLLCLELLGIAAVAAYWLLELL